MGGTPLNKPVVGIASTPLSPGYWEVASDGGIFSFGTAQFYGSTGGIPAQRSHRRHGADAGREGLLPLCLRRRRLRLRRCPFYGSMGGMHLNQPIVGGAVTPDEEGYRPVRLRRRGLLLRRCGATSAPWGEPTSTNRSSEDAITPHGGGYYLVASDGGVFTLR